jgi:hypothetical protein
MQLTPHGFSESNERGGLSLSQARSVKFALLTGQHRAFVLITCVLGVCLLPCHIRILSSSACVAPPEAPPFPFGLIHTWAVRASCRGSF